MNFIEYNDREMLVLDLANVLAEELESALLVHDQVSFAVPGAQRRGRSLIC